MSDNKYIITRSNYTFKEPHKRLKDGSVIYERDYMTLASTFGYDESTIPYGESNFKFVTNNSNHYTRRRRIGNIITKDGCQLKYNTEVCESWTLNDLDNGGLTKEGKIIPNPSKRTLLDYVYYGSCTELIKSSVKNILEQYPAELYVSNKPYYIYTDKDRYALGQNVLDNPVHIENPFEIDIDSKSINTYNTNINKLRYFCESFGKYVLYDAEGNKRCFCEWDVDCKDKKCYKDGDLMARIDFKVESGDTLSIYQYYVGGKKILITDSINTNNRISLNQTTIEDVFQNSLKDFDRFILNRDSQPLYSISIETPKETSTGFIKSVKKYSWPTLHGWNLDFESSKYNAYINDLLDIASFYDEYRTNNLWKNMTHDSIKNMDIQFSNPSKDEDISDYQSGIGNIQGLLYSYGRLFDDIKLLIDNIKSTNEITYNGNNNIPDYFLSDTLGLSGWEITNAVKTIDKTTTTDSLYSGDAKQYTVYDAYIRFLRNLKLNSRAIFSRKGTKQAIEMVFSLFGLSSYEFGRNYYNALPETSKIKFNGKAKRWEELTEEESAQFYDYELDEIVAVAKNKKEDVVYEDEILPIEYYNSLKTTSKSEFAEGTTYGLPLRTVYITVDEGGDDLKIKKYLIPWFDKKDKGLDGKPYFQMNGGWIKDMWTKITPDNSYDEYEETKNYMYIFRNVGLLQTLSLYDVNDGDIYYVSDLSDYHTYYSGITMQNVSHYFVIENKTKTQIYGTGGWVNIPQDKIDNKVGLGKKVAHIEEIVDEIKGNNPHIGYGKYDSGSEYLKYFKQVFKGAIDNNLFTDAAYDCTTGKLLSGITNSGFEVEDKVIDNVKCWYFKDENYENTPMLEKKYITTEEGDEIQVGYEETMYTIEPHVGKTAYLGSEVFKKSELSAFNFETQTSDDSYEGSANSVINSKVLTLTFNKVKYQSNNEFRNFLRESIMPYVKQVIPSTSMLEIVNIEPIEDSACSKTPTIIF